MDCDAGTEDLFILSHNSGRKPSTSKDFFEDGNGGSNQSGTNRPEQFFIGGFLIVDGVAEVAAEQVPAIDRLVFGFEAAIELPNQRIRLVPVLRFGSSVLEADRHIGPGDRSARLTGPAHAGPECAGKLEREVPLQSQRRREGLQNGLGTGVSPIERIKSIFGFGHGRPPIQFV